MSSTEEFRDAGAASKHEDPEVDELRRAIDAQEHLSPDLRQQLGRRARSGAVASGLPVEIEAFLLTHSDRDWADRMRTDLLGGDPQVLDLVQKVLAAWDEDRFGGLPTKTGVRLRPHVYQPAFSEAPLIVGPSRKGYEQYREPGPRGLYLKTRNLIQKADAILNQYWDDGDGYPLTLRQLFYKLVTTNDLKNTQADYKRLGDIMTEARYLGLISWDMLIDRTRTIYEYQTFADERAALEGTAANFLLDKWADQPTRVEVWVEKDAAIGTIQDACARVQVPLVSTRGYNSASGAKRAAERIGARLLTQRMLVLHIADLDPSGWDMTRDLSERLGEMLYRDVGSDVDLNYSLEIRRIALNVEQRDTVLPRDQVGLLLSQEVKGTDPRAKVFVKKFGRRCWELDALEPEYLQRIIREPVLEVRDEERWEASVAREEEARSNLRLGAVSWADILPLMKTLAEASRRALLQESGVGL
jgi:hypothetical protein